MPAPITIASAPCRSFRPCPTFGVRGHGVPKADVQALYEAAYGFFDLPLAEKQRVARPRPEQNRGYIGYGDETLARLAGNESPPDRKELWVTAELAGEVTIIDRAAFKVLGKVEFLPPGMRKSDVTPVGLAMTKDGKTAYVTLGHAAHVAVVDVHPIRGFPITTAQIQFHEFPFAAGRCRS